MTRQIIHVDMDAFYASVEELDLPELRGKCVVVGGPTSGRGVVSAASYAARKFGVHSAMPMGRAVKLCPQAVIRPVRMGRYQEISRQIHTIFDRFTPDVEPLSLDEAFLDVTKCRMVLGDACTIGQAIKDTIRTETGLTCSVGVAPNKFLAKLASDLDKPDGFVFITEENCQTILDPLPVGRIWGIGEVSQKRLEKHGITTIKHLRQQPAGVLAKILGNAAEELIDLARGIDHRPVLSDAQTKSISAEQTFSQDIRDKATLRSVLLSQVEHVAERLRRKGFQAKTVTVKLRYSDFRTQTVSQSLDIPSSITRSFWLVACNLFQTTYTAKDRPLRLIGFGLSGLTPEGSGQQYLFPHDDLDRQQSKIDQAMDAIRARYGRSSVRRGG